ncbi:MAG: UvrD-helicase domain-containing protein [Clostridia bacterium]|nr:UvrD-helicase domain-containing protein [Clostridia bacterium]
MSGATLQERYINIKKQLFETYYSFLNEEQRRAVFSTDGQLLVLAGAGSGKTTVLVNRVGFIIKYGNAYHSTFVPPDVSEEMIARLEDAKRLPREQLAEVLTEFIHSPCPPWQVLAITFTKKAAEEIRQRLAATLGEGVNVSDIWAGTFHSICVRIIRRYSDTIGYKSDFSIYDTDNTKSVLKDIMKELRIDEKSLQLKSIRGEISRAKNKLMTPEMYRREVSGDYRREKIALVYEKYQQRLTECNALDFDDIIMQSVRILEENEEARRYYGNKFRYVCVDEFQDTNEAQLKLTELLGSVWNNVMVVGDDDQSIYKFRGAVVQNIIDFGRQKGTQIIRLERNYRSTDCILDAANAVISKNTTRMGKKLYTERHDSSRITLHRAETQKSEAVYICERINELVVSGRYKYRDIAVLYRLNAISNAIETTMSASGIPHLTLSGQSFYERMEIKDLLAYLYVIVNPSDRERLKRIINVPRRAIGAKTVEGLFAIATEQGVDPIVVMRNADKFAALSRSAASLRRFAAMIDTLTDSLNGDISLEDFVGRVLDVSGYRQALVDAGAEEKERLDNLDEFISNVIDFEDEYRQSANVYVEAEHDGFEMAPNVTPFGILNAFLERCSLVADVDRYDESADAVVLMTMHSAKGLEFPVVFLPAMEDGVFPGHQNLNSISSEDMEEERRLAYVALTRAKDKIYITHTRNRMLYNQTSYNPLSQFVREIPDELISDETPDYDAYAYTPKPKFKTYFSAAPEYSERNASATSASTPKRPATVTLNIGDRVSHRVFGEGEIFSVKPMGADVLYEVVFDTAGTKKLMGSFAKLRKIN